MIAQLLAIARNAFTEAIRQPFYLVWLALVSFGIVLGPFLAAYTFDDDDKFATDISLSMLFMGGLFLAAFTASGVVGREIDNRTALTVISKPIARPVFVLGKFLGVAAALSLAWWDWALLYLLSIRQGALSTASTPWNFPVLIFGGSAILAATAVALTKNYVFHRDFGSAWARWLAILLPLAYLATLPFGPHFGIVPPLSGVPFAAILVMILVLQATMLFAAVATACSTRLGQAATLIACVGVLLVGLTSDYMLGRAAADFTNDQGVVVSQGATWAKALYAAVPNLHFLWLADALTQGTIGAAGPGYFATVTLYTLLMIVGVLGLAVALFQTRNAA